MQRLEAPSRRQVLIGGMSLAAVAGVVGPAAFPSPATGYRHHRFQHGVASGDPTTDAVVIWTRVTPTIEAVPGSGLGEPAEVLWEVAADEELTEVVTSGTVTTDPRSDHTVKLDVTGLLPGQTYYYRFTSGTDVSPIGRTTTTPANHADAGSLRFGVVSCANWQAGWFSAYRHLAERGDLDAVIHLGDYIYEYENGKYSYGYDWVDVRGHQPPHETVTLADYRIRHGQYKTDPDLQQLHAQVPFIVTWDDHEVADGWYPGGAFEHQPEEGSFDERVWSAQRAYDEWMPVRLGGTAVVGDGNRIYRRIRFGGLVDLLMLDLRGYRDERVDADDPATDAADRQMTGAEQFDWLVSELESSEARWKLIGNPVMVAPMLMPQRPRGQQLALVTTTDPMSWGPAEANTDTWDGYPVQRRALLQRIEEQAIDDVVFLSGDVHTAWANEIRGSGGAPVAAEFVCASVTSNNVDDYMGTPPRSVSVAMEESIVDLNPHVRFVNLDDHGYCVLEVDDAGARMEWWAISDRADATASTRRLATRTLTAGSSRIQTV
ncbi:alkaline phosphatase [Aeromicrobium sp. Leaf350]|uniref:alkaline phosphatase D family protein n=1 Tax=Aeromicrobium sp. Leaf350 TaxID=2876565 RepID=UPI001E36A0C8|nr:alkaline phosphatase D family protein [Aeromicrobium sp. Leaf350]